MEMPRQLSQSLPLPTPNLHPPSLPSHFSHPIHTHKIKNKNTPVSTSQNIPLHLSRKGMLFLSPFLEEEKPLSHSWHLLDYWQPKEITAQKVTPVTVYRWPRVPLCPRPPRVQEARGTLVFLWVLGLRASAGQKPSRPAGGSLEDRPLPARRGRWRPLKVERAPSRPLPQSDDGVVQGLHPDICSAWPGQNSSQVKKLHTRNAESEKNTPAEARQLWAGCLRSGRWMSSGGPPGAALPGGWGAASGDICFPTLAPGSPRPLSPGCVVILPTRGEGELGEVERGWVEAREMFFPLPTAPPFSFTSFNLQGKDFINVNDERVRRLRGPPSARGALGCGASPFSPSSPGSARVPAVPRGRPGPSPGRLLSRLLPRQLLVAAVIRLSVLVRGERGERASDSGFQDSPVG